MHQPISVAVQSDDLFYFPLHDLPYGLLVMYDGPDATEDSPINPALADSNAREPCHNLEMISSAILFMSASPKMLYMKTMFGGTMSHSSSDYGVKKAGNIMWSLEVSDMRRLLSM
uniref:Uncharacterized protein n=1 Tax=Vespula pensylvanica TaxID=30213 RepID=A0A834N2N2_VESPE|nr:hypothetical protein H0235_017080 [Vespula pensylvanica]